MRERFPSSMIMVAIAAAGAVIAAPIWQTAAQAPPASGGAPAPTTLNTPWGEPDLQGIIRCCSAPPNMQTRNSSPRCSEPN